MAHLLNYKYEIFPTKPQRGQLYTLLRQVRLQWNRAVTTRKKLKRALASGQFTYLLEKLSSEERNNNQGQRKRAIMKLMQVYPDVKAEDAPRLYDLRNIIGTKLLEDFGPQYLNTSLLAKKLKSLHKGQVQKRREDKDKGLPINRQAMLTVYWQLLRAINNYAGYNAKKFMDKSFKSSSDMSLSAVRANISGYSSSVKWNTAVKPSSLQRTYGAKGEPQYKRRGDGFTYQVQRLTANDLIRIRKKRNGKQIRLNVLHKGNAWVNIKYHRPLPDGGKIKQITVNESGGHFFAVFSVEVPDSSWLIAPSEAGWCAGIDPGVNIPLTVGLINKHTGESRQLAFKYSFIDKSLEDLEKIQQSLSLKQGPRRKRTVQETKDALAEFSKKRAIQKLPATDREKRIEAQKERLEKTMVRQEPSQAWRELNSKVKQLHYHVGNQRRDVLHKISRVLAEGCDVVAVGHWEPERQIGYRKQLKLLKSKVKRDEDGAAEALKELKESKSKQGAKGSKKRRRGGRDRSIATLRNLIDEKAERSGITTYTHQNESGSTMHCCICSEATGPKNDMSIREWTCESCNTQHNRDLNGAFNILKKADESINVVAQTAASVMEQNSTRTNAQGAMGQSGSNSRLHATGSCGKGASKVNQPKVFYPELWKEDVPKALKSLKKMGIVVTLVPANNSIKGDKQCPPP